MLDCSGLFIILSRQILLMVARYGSTQNNAISLLGGSEKENYVQLLQDNVEVGSKAYPLLPHQDPLHPNTSTLNQTSITMKPTSANITRQLTSSSMIQSSKRSLGSDCQVGSTLQEGSKWYRYQPLSRWPVQQKLPYIGFTRRDIDNQTIFTFNNQNSFIANTPWHARPQFKHIAEWEKERLNRLVTRDFNHGKRYKYDVPIRPEEKYEYVSDRLGHPEFFGTPFQRLFKLEKDLFHLLYLDQPFVKMPTQNPSSSLNFEQGEVLYENTRVMKWIGAFQLVNIAFLAYFGVVVPLNMAFKTKLVVDKADKLFFGQQHLWTPYLMDVTRLYTPISTAGVFYIIYATMRAITSIGGQYPVKVSYSKDKELLFVKRVDNYGRVVEDVYETANLEILPPRQLLGVQDLSSQDADGLWRITCLNSQRYLLLYNNDSFWNRKLKRAFLSGLTGFWDKSYYGYNRKEQEENGRKWRDEAYAWLDQQALPK